MILQPMQPFLSSWMGIDKTGKVERRLFSRSPSPHIIYSSFMFYWIRKAKSGVSAKNPVGKSYSPTSPLRVRVI